MYFPEKHSAALHVRRSPDLLIHSDSAQNLGLCPFESMLFIPKVGLQFHRATQFVSVVDRVRLSPFNVSMCIIEPVFVEKQQRQPVMNPKQGLVPVERRCDSEGRLEMVNGLLPLALGTIYLAKNTMRFADQKLFAFP